MTCTICSTNLGRITAAMPSSTVTLRRRNRTAIWIGTKIGKNGRPLITALAPPIDVGSDQEPERRDSPPGSVGGT
jgi:hypothetical protein